MSLSTKDQTHLINFIKTNNLAIKSHFRWENFARNLKKADALVLDINDVESLQKIIREIYRINISKSEFERISVRVSAGNDKKKNSESYSFTSGAVGDVILRLVGAPFNFILPTDDQQVMQVGASVQIGELENELYNKHNLSLSTSSLIPYVTVAGLSANAGHGTGKDQPSFAGLIRAMTFCLPTGEIVRIDRHHPAFNTIRASHLGLFGVLLNVELECMPAAKMQCVMEARSVPEFLAELKDGLFLNDPYVSVMYVPTYQADELTNTQLKNVIIYRWRKVSKDVEDVNVHTVFSHLAQNFEVKMQESFHITDLLRSVPALIPYFMRYLVCNFSIGRKDSMMVGPWPLMHYQTAFPRQITDVDYLFPVNKNADEIAQAFLKCVTELQNSSQKKQFPVTYAIYLRFFTGTKGGLSTSDGDKDYICGLDIVTSPNQPGLNELETILNPYFIKTLHAKPHWGKTIPADINFAEIYGKSYDEFKKTLNDWYKNHNMEFSESMFMNQFNRKILGLTLPRLFANQMHREQATNPKYSSSYMAGRVLPYVEGEHEAAQQLRKALQLVAAPRYKNATFFTKSKSKISLSKDANKRNDFNQNI